MTEITQDFTEQFQVLLPKNTRPCREVISALLEKMNVDKRNYQIGKTKVSIAPLGAATDLHPAFCHAQGPPAALGQPPRSKGLC